MSKLKKVWFFIIIQTFFVIFDLFESYKARVFIDYLETTPEEQKRRNHNRDNVVPEETINDMIGKLVNVYLKECKGFYYIGEVR